MPTETCLTTDDCCSVLCLSFEPVSDVAAAQGSARLEVMSKPRHRPSEIHDDDSLLLATQRSVAGEG